MAVVDILQPVLTGGIRNTNFFNGRLLAAQDLTEVQIASAQQHRQLGRIMGEGVAYGLEVNVGAGSTPAAPILHIAAGLAVARTGDVVSVAVDVDLALTAQSDVTATAAGLFAECQPPVQTLLTNPGIYILTAMRASALSKESAPMTTVGTEGFGTTCGSRYALEGAKFRWVRFDLGSAPDPASLRGAAAQVATQLDPLYAQLSGASAAQTPLLQAKIAPLASKLRNVLAYLCFAPDALANVAADPFGRTGGDSLFAEFGIVDQLRDQNALLDCEVPIALLYWTTTGLQFVDMWAVRRPVARALLSGEWAPFAGGRRASEGLAMLLQFQYQMNDLLSAAPLNGVTVTDYFRFLPAAGLLPLSASKTPAGLQVSQFFQGRTYRGPIFMEGAKLEELLCDSFTYRPIDLALEEFIWLYSVRENFQAFHTNSPKPAQAYVVFCNGHLPYQGDSRFDGWYWDYSNYVLRY